MSSNRAGAVDRALAHFDAGRYIDDLARLVAIPTQSQLPDHQPELYRYLESEIRPFFENLAFDVEVFDNPVAGKGPILLATRHEDDARPTVLTYGHGDVVTAFAEEWREGLDPWVLEVEGDRVYGRGVVDNKGQHLLAMVALATVCEARGGRLGFNAKVLIETGEEQGSAGLRDFIEAHRADLAADVYYGIDGPRHSTARAEISLGNRGAGYFDLSVDLGRSGGLHSGHFGGVMPDAGIILGHALASITDAKGRILVDGWLPEQVPNSVRAAARDLLVDPVDNMPAPDPEWGEPWLDAQEKTMTTTSFIVLAYQCGNPDSPVNAVPSTARARCQIRHTADVPREAFYPALRRHLDAGGFGAVTVVEGGQDLFPATRTDPDHPWVRWTVDSIARTTGAAVNVAPSSGGSGPRGWFADNLGCPAITIPHSYYGCGQHGPNEHGLLSLFREGLGFMTGLYWDLGEARVPGRGGDA